MRNNFIEKFNFLIIIWNLLNKKRKLQLFYFQILNFTCAISEVLNLFFIKIFLDKLLNQQETNFLIRKLPLADHLMNANIIFLGILLISFISLSSGLRISAIYFQFRLAALLALDLGSIVFAEILYKPYKWHKENSTSFVLGLLSNDVDRVRDILQVCLSIFINLFIVFFIVLPLFVLDPKFISILFLLINSFFAFIYFFSKTSLIKRGEKITQSYQDGLRQVSETLGSIKDILINNNQKFFLANYQRKFHKYYFTNGLVLTQYQIPRYLVEAFIISIIVIISLLFNSTNGGIQTHIPLLGTIFLGIYRLLNPLQQCFLSISLMKANSASWQKVKPYLIKTKIHRTKFEENITKKFHKQDDLLIEMENVSFRYSENKPWIIKNCNLIIKEGDRIGFVGKTGSGKSTCADLIAGLLKPNSGCIYINEVDINKSDSFLNYWQKSLGHVPQDIYLLEDTFKNNIAFGVPNEKVDFKKVSLAAKKACLHELIIQNRLGYDEIIGERGKLLSGGQIQRVALARAFYKDSRLIIFDEATSALDNLTEKAVLDSVSSLDKKITLIFIAHRLSTLEICDSIAFFSSKGIYCDSFNNLYDNNLEFRNLVDKKLE